MSQFKYFDDLTVGDLYLSPAQVVTVDEVHRFASLTGDLNPLHLDEEFAQRSPFGRPIAHGLLGLSYVAGLASKSPAMEHVALLEVNQWQFLRPIYFGDEVRVESEVIDLEPSGRKRGRVTWRRRLINQHGQVVQQGYFDILVTRRSALTSEDKLEDEPIKPSPVGQTVDS